ncbi:MAG TPA: TetR/AcrR family transcriptional regulator [Firmicutes bacterium]|nr:TetR/AcrR family transcriptional regulator [Bacillota bacterium]
MGSQAINTLEQILEAGKQEFLEKGYRQASLRNITKGAGVTTGAFYGYFKSKSELFESLVEVPAKTFLGAFERAQEEFAGLPPEEQPDQMGRISGSCIEWMVEYIYQHFDAFRLILCCSEGTKYENFVHTMAEIEVEGTHRFLEVLKGLGHVVPHIDEQLEHILVSGLFSSFFEIVVHEMPQEKAVRYVRELRTFYTAGWQKIMGL